MNRLKLCIAGSLLMTGLVSGSLQAQKWTRPLGHSLPITTGRCWDFPGKKNNDSLESKDAKIRVDWAFRCEVLDEKTAKFFSHYYNPVTDKWIPRPKGHEGFPTFAYDDRKQAEKEGRQPTYPVWKPDLEECYLPEGVVWLNICEAVIRD